MTQAIPEISPLMATSVLNVNTTVAAQDNPSSPSAIGFANHLSNMVGDIDGDIKKADEALVRVATGQSEFLHRDIAALEKANMSLRLGLEVRNRLVEAYQQLSQMQI